MSLRPHPIRCLPGGAAPPMPAARAGAPACLAGLLLAFTVITGCATGPGGQAAPGAAAQGPARPAPPGTPATIRADDRDTAPVAPANAAATAAPPGPPQRLPAPDAPPDSRPDPPPAAPPDPADATTAPAPAAVDPAASRPPSAHPHPGLPATGIATVYHHRFHGRRTSSGMRYDHHGLSAAHRTLPMGTRVRVTALDTGRSVVVTINDRGPWSRDRLIDLSSAAAKQLGMHRPGTLRVRVEPADAVGRHAGTSPRSGPAARDAR